MRLQLAITAAVVLGAAATARADGDVSVRGVYYKERATRVVQPMMDAAFDVGTRGVVDAHFLVDAITSASSSSGADNAKAFDEKRYEGGAGYTYDFRFAKLGAEAKYSTESDYISRYGGIHGSLDLFQKNTVLAGGAGISRDKITAAAAQGPMPPALECKPGENANECALSVTSVFVSASQILSPDIVAGISYDFSALDGYQSNPYRMALADDGTAAERHPTSRHRSAVAGVVRYYYAPSRTTFIGAYRYYHDNWKVSAHTPELRIVQEVGHVADATLAYRFYTQTHAFFYHDRYSTVDPSVNRYISDDAKLEAFQTHVIEAKLGVLGEAFGATGRWSGARFEGILSYAAQGNRFGNAIIAHVALTVPIEY